MEARKPLGRKAYGHIPHLPGSRIGPGDHHVSEGQARIATTKARDKHDLVIVQEKLDGSCVAVYMDAEMHIHALGRAGYLASTSRWEQHQLFAAWARENADRFRQVLLPGERLVGEWLAQAHGTRYALWHEPFVAFDLMGGETRMPYHEFVERVGEAFVIPSLIARDDGPIAIATVLDRLSAGGSHGAVDPVEGAVWRVERRGKVDFIAKYVRFDKVDGLYLPEVSGGEPVWNWRPAPLQDEHTRE